MSGWKEVEKGTVKMIHHSTMSIIEVLIKKEIEVEQGQYEPLTIQLFLDYARFKDLRNAMNEVDHPKKE